MLRTYVTAALRSLRKHRLYALLNGAGLAVGLAVCLLVGLYILDEWSYDRHHEHADRIVRMGIDFVVEGEVRKNVATPGLLAPTLEADLPEVEHAVRLIGSGQIFRPEARGTAPSTELFREDAIVYADSTLFDVFTLPLRHGDPATALDAPNRLVLSVPLAEKLFGTTDVVGATVYTETGRPLTVTGVMESIPEQSHARFEGVISLATAQDPGWWYENWFSVNFLTYVLLREGTDLQAFRTKLPAFLQRRAGTEMTEQGQRLVLHAEALTDLRLRSDRGYPGMRGSLAALYLFGGGALFVLLIACVNFMNLATARSVERAKEVGVRKMLGASRAGLAAQFLAEAVLLSGAAFVAALALVQLALPTFATLAGKTLTLSTLGPLLPVFGLLALGVGVLAGAYPAFVLSAFRPAIVLKGAFARGRQGRVLRQGLVVLQFGIAVALLAGTSVMFSQLRYMQGRDLGFDPGHAATGQLLTADLSDSDPVRIASLKQHFLAHPAVTGVTSSITVPTGGHPRAGGAIERPNGDLRDFSVEAYFVDTAFVDVYGLKVIAGQAPGAATTSADLGAYVLNETAVREAGYATPVAILGQRARFWGYEGEIVGVVRDFHTSGLQEPVEPLALLAVDQYHSVLTLRIQTDDLSQTLGELDALWSAAVPSRPFDYTFLDEAFGAQYEAERRFGRLFGILTGLAIFIGCLGLFGLAAYAASQRTKEIGIRKVLGASTLSLLALLTQDAVRLVVLAFLVAAPLAYAAMDRWLDGFAYRIDLDAGPFALAGLLVLLVALTTVGGHAYRTAVADPVKALRYD